MIHFIQNIESLNALIEEHSSKASSVFILTDENVSNHCIPGFISACSCLAEAEVIELEAGEANKALEVCGHLWTHLLERNADRHSLVINLGGGVISDLGGFVATTYKRGIQFLNIPTTLMGMVDAAIGGKNGIDHDEVKNCIGTFSQPLSTIVYPGFLETLDARQLKSGFAEMLKYGLIAEEQLWKDLIAIDTLTVQSLSPFIKQCATIKEQLVAEDYKEGGKRKLLNLGHTVGHALESFYIQQGLLMTHGECVAAGIAIEAKLAFDFGICSEEVSTHIYKCVSKFFALKDYSLPPFDSLFSYLKNDKKNKEGSIRFVLPSKIGKAVYDVEIDAAQIEKSYTTFI